MYSLINNNLVTLLPSIAKFGGVDDYIYLIGAVRNTNVTTDREFQGRYRSYWRLNGAGLGNEFCDKYFEHLETLKRAGDPNLKTIAQRLNQIPCNGKYKLHFSFSTKLAHMLKPDLPVYDSQVRQFYFLPHSETGSFETKLAERLRSYRFLIGEYARVIEQGLLAPAMDAFRIRFKGEFTDVKVIDTLIWRFSSMLADGAVCDGTIEYR